MEPALHNYFGDFGGQFVAEPLVGLLDELSKAYRRACQDPRFTAELAALQTHYVGRPTPLSFLARSSEQLGGARIFLKREDLAHTGAHKINNALGQALLAKYMGKQRIIAETGAGQHGVATATACALLGLDCTVYMGAVDAARQAPNLQRMHLLGAKVELVQSGSRTLKDAINEAIRDWISNVTSTHYLIGSVVGPAPFPAIVRHLQSIIGEETKRQSLAQIGRLPDVVIACVGGGSNAIGMFAPFIEEPSIRLMGVQAGGNVGQDGVNIHSAPLLWGRPGVLQGAKTMLLQDADGQILKTHSIAPGLDYPGVGPEHASLAANSRVTYTSIDDSQALAAYCQLSRWEGIIPALESAHAVAQAFALAPSLGRDQVIVVNLSGRGDKDLATVEAALGKPHHPAAGEGKPL